MVRRVCMAVLLTAVIGQTAMAQSGRIPFYRSRTAMAQQRRSRNAGMLNNLFAGKAQQRPTARKFDPRANEAIRQATQVSATPREPNRLPQIPVRTAAMSRPAATYAVSAPMPAAAPIVGGAPMMGAPSMGHYPQTSAGLYASPQPNIPWQVGSSAITNQAFHPHEFLYAHKYKAIYPPYYYKVRGGWMVTPFGVWSQEKWQPMGTEVSVKYHSRINKFKGFIPPVIR